MGVLLLKIRVIPTLLWKDVGLVKGKSFDSWRRVGTILPAIRVYNTREVDELILVDINATAQNRDPDYLEIEGFAGDCFVPLTIGGGINNIDQITRLLRAGADKVSINSASFTNPQIITEAASRFGSQCVVVSIDAKVSGDKKFECVSHSGKTPTGLDPATWAKKLQDLGAGEILLTSVDRDGTMTGYDLNLIEQVVKAVTIPVIASGGAGNYQHMLDAVNAGASAVAAAAIFHYTEQTPLEAKNFLSANGVPIRNANIK